MLSIAARSRSAISVAASRAFVSTWSAVPQGMLQLRDILREYSAAHPVL